MRHGSGMHGDRVGEQITGIPPIGAPLAITTLIVSVAAIKHLVTHPGYAITVVLIALVIALIVVPMGVTNVMTNLPVAWLCIGIGAWLGTRKSNKSNHK